MLLWGVAQMFAGISQAQRPEAAAGSDDDIARVIETRDDMIRLERLSQAMPDGMARAWMGAREAVRDWLGLEAALTYDALLMGGVSSGEDVNGGSGDATLNMRWQVFPRLRQDLLVVAARVRHRHAFGGEAPSALGREAGAFWGFVDGFTDNGLEVPELYLEQQLLDRRLLVRYGQLSMDDLFDDHRLRNPKRSFLNQALSNSPAAGFPGYGLGAVARWKGSRGWDITAGMSNMQSSNLSEEVNWTLSDALFEGLQIGRDFEGWRGRPARWQILGWNADALPEFGLTAGRGASLTLEQEWREREQTCVRCAWSDGEAAAAAMLVALGYARDIRRQDRFGAALAVGNSSSGSDEWQGVLEIFYRWHIGPNVQITPDVQLVAGDGIADGAGWLLIGGLRVSVTF